MQLFWVGLFTMDSLSEIALPHQAPKIDFVLIITMIAFGLIISLSKSTLLSLVLKFQLYVVICHLLFDQLHDVCSQYLSQILMIPMYFF